MNYKNWDNRKTNRGRGRGSAWNWRGRGHRMPVSNTFLPNLGWTNNLPNYNQYHVPHHDPNTYSYNPRHLKPSKAPINIISNIITKPASPLPGSEEYTQNKIQQTSDLIKRQLNIDSETCSVSESNCPSNTTFSDYRNNSETDLHKRNAELESANLCTESKKTGKQVTKRNKTVETIDVQEIHDKIIKHISSLSYSKKMSLVNQSSSVYDIAIHEVQKQKRLELSRALRDISKRQTQNSDDGEVINAIIPDIGIKIEDLPNNVIAALSNSLNLHLDDNTARLVDPEECFKQAEEILNVNFERDDHHLKLLQHNFMISNRLEDDNRRVRSISKTDSFDPTLLDKSAPHYQFSNPDYHEGTARYDSYAPKQIQKSSTALDKTITQDDNDKSDDDYAKDIEFNNFCFENFDLNKSYLVPHISAKSENYICDSNVTGDIPKISVRKDILQDANIVSDVTQNNEIAKSEMIDLGSFEVNLPAKIESQYENTKDVSDGKEVIQSLMEESYSVIPQVNIAFDEILLDSAKQISTTIPSEDHINIIKNDFCISNIVIHKTESCSLSSNDHSVVLPDILSTTVNQELQVSQIPQSLDHCTQKRWKSPGEKKMMADIQPNLNTSAKSNLTMIAPTINHCRLDNVAESMSMSKIESSNVDNLITNVVEGNATIEVIQHRISENDLIFAVDQMEETEIAQPEKEYILTEKKELKSNETDNVEENAEIHAFVKLKVTNKLAKVKSNASEKSQNSKYKKVKSVESKNSPKRLSSKHVLEDDSATTEPLITNPPIITHTDQTVLNDIKIINKDDNLDVSKTNNIKEHRKVKTAAEKKGTMPISNNAYTQTDSDKKTEKISKNVYIQTTLDQKLKSENKRAEKVDLKPIKHIHTQTDNKTKTDIVKTTEKKETQTVKNLKSVHIQTSFEKHKPNLPVAKTKEYKNVEIQVTSSITSSSTQTKAAPENSNTETQSPNYFSYLLKLKQIDLEIEKLIEVKKNLYTTIEKERNMSSSISHRVLSTNIQQQEQVDVKEEITANISPRKHKKTDSDIEVEEILHNPKRKKRHRNSKRNFREFITSNVDDTTDLSRTDDSIMNDEGNREDKRKPLSIKISLKNLIRSSPKSEPEYVIQESFDDLTTRIASRRNSTEESCHSVDEVKQNIYSVDEVKQNIYGDVVSRKRNSAERKCMTENTSHVKRNAVNKSSNCHNEADNYPEKKIFRGSKNKKIKSKQDLNIYSVKLSADYSEEKVLGKRCHVLIERCTVEYLQNLRKNIQEKRVSQENNLPAENITDTKLDASTISGTDLEFKDFLGAVLDIKLIQDVLLAVTDSGYLYFFNVNTGIQIYSLNISEKPLTSICVSINNIYVGCLMGVLTIVDFDSKSIAKTIHCDEGIQCLEKEWEYIFMGSHRGHIMRYNFKKNKLEPSLKIYDSNIFAIKATQEGARRVILVASRNAQITVRDAMSGLLMRTMDSQFCPTVYAILSEKNFVYCGTSQHDILVYTFHDGQLKFKYEAANSKGIVCLKIMGDTLFAGSYNGNIYVYSISSKQFLGQIAGPGGMLLSMVVYGNKLLVGTKSNKLKSVTIPQVFLDQASS